MIRQPTKAFVAELCFTALPDVDPIDVMQVVLRARPGARLSRPDGPSGPFVIEVPVLDGLGAVEVTVSPPVAVDLTTAPARDLTQTWGWTGGREAAAVTLAHTTHTVSLDETSGRIQGSVDRAEAFLGVVAAAMSAAPPAATWWPESEQALEPATALARHLGGLVNVRMFNDAERSGYVVMDTLGMASFGLPDLQCRFRGLEYDRVAALLYGFATDLVRGATIEDGQTLDGIEPGRKWRVYTVGSTVGPDRPVLALRR